MDTVSDVNEETIYKPDEENQFGVTGINLDKLEYYPFGAGGAGFSFYVKLKPSMEVIVSGEKPSFEEFSMQFRGMAAELPLYILQTLYVFVCLKFDESRT